MLGRPSRRSDTESPTGCTKQLISVAWMPVPAAELMRPAGTKPFSCAHRKRAAQASRWSSASACASERATRSRTSVMLCSSPFAYFSSRTSVEISCGAARRAGSGRLRSCLGSPFMSGLGSRYARGTARNIACARSIRCNFDAVCHSGLQYRSDGPPRMVARSTWSGRERSSHSRFPPVPRARLVHLLPFSISAFLSGCYGLSSRIPLRRAGLFGMSLLQSAPHIQSL